MMRSRFDEQLALLNRELIEMGARCEEVIALAAKSMADGDVRLAKQVAPLDAEIDQKERDIESLCLKLLLQQQPVARDLRQISAALKMITDMERIGDQAEDIAEIVTFLAGRGPEDSELMREMARATIKMVTDSVDAFVKRDILLAEQVVRDDDTVDAYFDQVKHKLIEKIAAEPSDGEYALDLLMIASMDRLSYDKEEVKAFLAEMDLNGISIFNVGSNTVTLASGWDLMAFIRQMISPENGGDAQ